MANPKTYSKEEYVSWVIREIPPLEQDGSLRKVSKLIKINDVSGFVHVGCLVKITGDGVSVSFFISMSKTQAEQFKQHHSNFPVYQRNDAYFAIIDWVQYSFLVMK